ncbi:hypothetical protein [Amycolatopsis sp. cmx-4-54]|uniref:hypothetical protein n=1 Tax=Amycolatopsis sp. cmx-4-54 TaxID=2790936 RepID=UPI0039795077
MKRCFNPSEYMLSPQVRSWIGDFAEIVIRHHSCANVRGSACSPFDPRVGGHQEDFFDQMLGPHRCDNLAEYLGKHNSWIDPPTLGGECLAEGQEFAVPDMITHRAPPDPGEFYEVKPNSADGKYKGRRKVEVFNQTIARHHLPYVAGTRYDVDEKRLLVHGYHWLGQYRLFLHWWRAEPGLLLYEFCFEFDSVLENVPEELIRAIIIAMILVVLAAGLSLPWPRSRSDRPHRTVPVDGDDGPAGRDPCHRRRARVLVRVVAGQPPRHAARPDVADVRGHGRRQRPAGGLGTR